MASHLRFLLSVFS
ncbi:rCG23430 [Rattus norvegicus]|uniref:RCG23430 n=1 Tax=Rattus norvegicus TaxID=10116 RepID=A6KH88_RAT|nr:rCG23430 [Rattus norvegicus]